MIVTVGLHLCSKWFVLERWMQVGQVLHVGKEIQWAFKVKEKNRKARWLGWRHLSFTFTATCGPSNCPVHGEERPKPWRCSCGKECREGTTWGLPGPNAQMRVCCRADLTHMPVVTFNQPNASLCELHFFRAMALQSMLGMYTGFGHTQNLFNVALWLLVHSGWC